EHCDSVVVLLLTIKNSKTAEKTINACHQYVLDGERITETGTYYRTYTASNGCDSTVTYHINILDDVTNEVTVYACGSYTWAGNVYTQTNDYVRRFESFVGCDSTVTMHLFIGEPNYGIIDEQTACESYTWEGTTYNSSGEYTKTLTNRYGCDSVVTLRLTINPTYTRTVNLTACDSYEWEGDTYTESGTYQKTLHSVAGCDSLVILNLTINYSVEHEFWDTICGPYPWDGRTYTSSGDHEWVYTAANGCDSVVTLHLVYHELVTDARDGNTYCTMEYGDQVWMTSNMRYLPQVNNTSSTTASLYYIYGYTNTTIPSNNTNYNIYGTLYNYNSAQTACPTGWHLPSKAEWEQLIAYLGQNSEYICNGNSINVAMSLASTEYWSSSNNTCAVGYERSQNNASGFSALPGGYYNGGTSGGSVQSSNFVGITDEGGWWTSTNGQRAQMTKTSATVNISQKTKSWGFSVRCVKDND
ncbi:MAG: fibrobacter succinogenes major paralogous domain-containing protein, partial [Bacteroidales bacterium]|nr:fibrobacter succinogenes major paralogous domain-containing protein [Bacteroidales bacterium]